MRGFGLLAAITAGASIVAVAYAAGVGDIRGGAGPAPGPAAAEPARGLTQGQLAGVAQAYGKLPVTFVENRGQADARVRYYAQGKGFGFYVTPREVMLALARDQAADGLALALRFVDRNPLAVPEGRGREAGDVNYLQGTDPAAWRTGLGRYREIVYRELWPGIDLQLQEQSGSLKYQFRVRPGASPNAIRLAYDGADGLSLDPAGTLRIQTALGELRDSTPVSYQDIDGVRTPVASSYALGAGQGFGFDVGAYRADRELIIDPGVQYTTFLGGNSAETATGIAADAGNVIVAGTTQSPDFPTTAGAFDRTGAAQNFADVFVTKLNAAGTALVYSTFVGGSNMEFGNRLAVDAAGNAYVTGTTKSSNFPTTGGAFDRSIGIPPNCPRCATDVTDGFAFKLNAAGSALTYSTYLGGVEYDAPRGIAVDGAGNAYVTGETLSSDFPTTAGAFSRTRRGEYDVFATKLNPTGSGLVYSTFLGGAAVDNGGQVQVDSGGNAYLLGSSSSTDFPTTAGAFDTTANGAFDATLTKLNPAGSALVYSTFIGSPDFDGASGLAVDGAGNAYLSGGTAAGWPVTPGAYDTTNTNGDAFVTKVNPAGSGLVFSTFLGGSDFDSASDLVLDAAGNVWVTGGTSSADFPVTAGAPDTTFNGGGDAQISELNATGSALLFATYLGGSNAEGGADIVRDPAGDIYVTGSTFSQNFPATVGAFDRVWNGDLQVFWGDAFVTKLDVDATTSTPTAPPGVPAAPTLVSPSNASSQPQPITFDWNTTANAVSYTIQVDDSSAFSAPLEREQSVTESIYATTGLSAGTHFWRVRGVNSAGVAGPFSTVRSFTAQAPPPPAGLGSLDVNPSSVVGGNASSGTIVMSAGPATDVSVSLSSSNPAVARVPATATVPANSFTGGFVVSTSAVTASTAVVITASYAGDTRTATLTVTPGGAPAATSVQALSMSPATVNGGDGTSGVVTLSGAAPAGGTTVVLTSSNAAVAPVPSSMTVPAGSTLGGFSFFSGAVTTSTTVTITATAGGQTRSATLTVNPASSPPPAQSATVTVTVSGRSGERVVSSPAGISVTTGSSGSAAFASGASVTLSVSSGRDAIWSGACSSNGRKARSCTFTATGSAAVTANVQ